jgi:hypothetical protein
MDELELLRELRDDRPDNAARERARRDLHEQMRAEARRPRRGRRPHRRWTLVVSGLAAATAIAVTVALVTGVDDATIAPAPATAKQALERAAMAAEQQPERPLAPGEYFYVRERDAYLSTTAGSVSNSASPDTMPTGWSVLMAPTERETWIDREGRARIVIHPPTREPTFPGPRDRERWVAAGRPELSWDRRSMVMRIGGEGGFTAGATTLTYAQLSALPSEGEPMYRRLIELAGDAGSSPDEEAFTIINDLLQTAPVPARVRAGLYRAAGHIKGVRYAGEVRDELGRRGLAVDLRQGGQRQRLVFDPDTSQILVEQDVLTKRMPYVDAGPGFVMGYRIVLEQGVVKSDTARP